MKRNYACEEMINEVKALRAKGITRFYCDTSYIKENGEEKRLKFVVRHTAQGISSYANQMFLKYGDTTKVEVTYIDWTDKELPLVKLTTYLA